MAQYEKVTAAEGQTEFNLGFTYIVGSGSLLVFQNGQLLTLGVDYLESSSTQVIYLHDDVEAEDIFVFVKTAQQTNQVIQDTTRAKGDSFTFRFIAPPGLTNVKLSIYDDNNIPVLVNQTMTEIATTGVYKFKWLLANVGVYLGVMNSPQAESKVATEIRVLPVEAGGGAPSTVINTIGVGKRC